MAGIGTSLVLKDKFTSVLKTVDSTLSKTTRTMDRFKDAVTGPARALNQLGEIASSAINRVQSAIRTGLTKATAVVKSNVERILGLFGNFGNRISNRLGLTKVTSKFSEVFNSIRSTTSAAMSRVSSVFGNAVSKITDAARRMGDRVKSGFTTVVNSVKNGFNNMNNFMKRTGNAFRQFGNEVNNAFSKVRSSTSKITGAFSQMFGALSVFGLVQKGIGVIQNSMDGAISRFDTMNQFPKIMGMWGHSTEASQAAIDKLSDGIDGLPTKLDEVVSTTQRLTSITGDLDKSVDTTVALNNAFIASGSGAADASRGMEQFVQMLSTGKVDMMGWRTLQETMPGALAETANAFGFAGQSASNDFYSALQDGEITFKQFQDKLIELNEGTGGFAEQAIEASGGVRTAWTNLGTAVSRGIASTMTAIDDALESQGLLSIEDSIFQLRTVIDGSFSWIQNNVPSMISNVKDVLGEMWDAFSETGAVESFTDAFQSAGDALSHIAQNIDYAAIGKFAGDVIRVFSDITKAVSDFVSDIDPVVLDKATDAIIMAVGAIGALKIGKGAFGAVTLLADLGKAAGNFGRNMGGAFGSLFGKGKKPTTPALPTENPLDDMAKSAPTATKFDWGSAFSPMIDNLTSFAKNAGNLVLIWGAIELIGQLADAMKQIDEKVPSDLSSLAPKMLNMGIGLGAMAGIIGISSKLTNKNPIKAIQGLVVVAGLSANIILAAEAMQQVNDKVSSNIGEFASKVANIAIGIGVMGVLVGAVGFLTSLNPLAAVAGLAMVAGLSLEIMLAAEAMQQLNDKVSSNMGDIASKMGSVAIAIGAMGLIVGAVGALVATGIGAVIAAGGLVTVALIAGEIMLVAEAMKQLDEKVPENMGSVESKVANIASVIESFNEANLGSVIDIFSNAVGFINTAVITAGIDKFIAISDKLVTFSTITIPQNIEEKADQIETAISAFSKSSFGDLISSLITTADMSVISGTIDTFVDLSKDLQRLGSTQIDEAAAITNIEKIKNVVDGLGTSTFGSIFSNMIESGSMSTAKSSINAMNELLSPINRLAAVELNSKEAIGNITKIKGVVETLGTATLGDLFSSLIQSGQMANVATIISEMIQVRNRLNAFAHVSINVDEVSQSIDDINTAIEKLGEGSLGALIGSMISSGTLSNVSNTLDTMIDLKSKFNQLGATELNMEGITANINNIKTAIGLLNDFPTATGAEGVNAIVESIINVANNLNSLANVAEVDASGITASLESISNSFKTMNVVAKGQLDEINASVTNSMVAMQNSFNTGMTSSNMIVARGSNQIVATVNTLRSRMHSAGYYAMTGLTAGINAGSGSAISAARSVANSVSRTIQSALDIHSPSRVMIAFGRYISEGLAGGILAGRRLVTEASEKLASAVMPGDMTPSFSTPSFAGGGIHINENDLDDMRMNAGQTITIKNKQLAPQIEINVKNDSGEPVDTDEIVGKVEKVIIDLIDSDLG